MNTERITMTILDTNGQVRKVEWKKDGDYATFSDEIVGKQKFEDRRLTEKRLENQREVQTLSLYAYKDLLKRQSMMTWTAYAIKAGSGKETRNIIEQCLFEYL